MFFDKVKFLEGNWLYHEIIPGNHPIKAAFFQVSPSYTTLLSRFPRIPWVFAKDQDSYHVQPHPFRSAARRLAAVPSIGTSEHPNFNGHGTWGTQKKGKTHGQTMENTGMDPVKKSYMGHNRK